MNRPNRYTQIIERIFFEHYQEGADEVCFERGDIVRVASDPLIDRTLRFSTGRAFLSGLASSFMLY
jgi:hypothetical protein